MADEKRQLKAFGVRQADPSPIDIEAANMDEADIFQLLQDLSQIPTDQEEAEMLVSEIAGEGATEQQQPESSGFLAEAGKSVLRGATGLASDAFLGVSNLAMPNLTRAAMLERGTLNPENLLIPSIARKTAEAFPPGEMGPVSGFLAQDLPQFATSLGGFYGAGLAAGPSKLGKLAAASGLGGALGAGQAVTQNYRKPLAGGDEKQANMLTQGAVGAALGPLGAESSVFRGIRPGKGALASSARSIGVETGVEMAEDAGQQLSEISTISPEKEYDVQQTLKTGLVSLVGLGALEGAKYGNELVTERGYKSIPSEPKFEDPKISETPELDTELAPEQREAAAMFTMANGLQPDKSLADMGEEEQGGVKAYKPNTKLQAAIADMYQRMGLRMVFVGREDGEAMSEAEAVTSKDGRTVVADINMDARRILPVLLAHEPMHSLQKLEPEVASSLSELLQTYMPEMAAEARENIDQNTSSAMLEANEARKVLADAKKSLREAKLTGDEAAIEKAKSTVGAAEEAYQSAWERSPKIKQSGPEYERRLGDEVPATLGEQFASLMWVARKHPEEFGRFMARNYSFWTKLRGAITESLNMFGLTDNVAQWNKDAKTLIDAGIAMSPDIEARAASKIAIAMNKAMDALKLEPKDIAPISVEPGIPLRKWKVGSPQEAEAFADNASADVKAKAEGRKEAIFDEEDELVGEMDPQRLSRLRMAPLKALKELLGTEEAFEKANTYRALQKAGWNIGQISSFMAQRRAARDMESSKAKREVAQRTVRFMKKRLSKEQLDALNATESGFYVDQIRAAIDAAKMDKEVYEIEERGNRARTLEAVDEANEAWSRVDEASRFSLREKADKAMANSKVRDEDGNLMEVYHGSGTEITEFDYAFTGKGADQLGPGFYFSSNEGTARGYTYKARDEQTPKLGGQDKPTVHKVFLNLKNPLDRTVRGPISKDDVAKILRKSSELEEALDNWGEPEDESRFDNAVSQYTGGKQDRKLDLLQVIYNDFFRGRTEEFHNAVRDVLGYDGVADQYKENGKTEWTFVAWFPEQIKSSVNNSGYFDPESRDIRYSIGDRGKKKNLRVPEDLKGTIPHVMRKDGTWVGGPDNIKGYDGIRKLRERLLQLAKEGEPGRFWYERSSKAILKLAQGDKVEAEKIAALIAIYSPLASVSSNTAKAISAYIAYKAGIPIRGVSMAAHDKKANEYLYEGKDWDGRKTNTFWQALMMEIDPSVVDPTKSTMDMWVSIALDYGKKNVSPGNQYTFAEHETRIIGEKLGWTPHQTQAAIWTAIKARIDRKAEQIARKKIELKNGIGHMVFNERKGKSEFKIVRGREKEHYRLAHKRGMSFDFNPKWVDVAKSDFWNALEDRMVMMSWETIPGRRTGVLPNLIKAPLDVRMEYHKGVLAITMPEGKDKIVELLGLPASRTFQGVSAWEGDVGPGLQSKAVGRLTPENHEKNKPLRTLMASTDQMFRRLAAARAYVHTQDAVVYGMPYYDSPDTHNAVEFSTERELTLPEMELLYKTIIDVFTPQLGAEASSLAPGWLPAIESDELSGLETPAGARVANFTSLPLKAFKAGMLEVHKRLPEGWGGGTGETSTLRSVGRYMESSWSVGDSQDESDQGYDATVAGESPDIQAGLVDLRRAVAAFNRDFAAKHVWEVEGDIAGSGPELAAANRAARIEAVIGRGERAGYSVAYQAGLDSRRSDQGLRDASVEDFVRVASANKASHPFGTSVDVLSADQYQNYTRIVVEKDGETATASISPEGELGTVTKSPGASADAVKLALDLAIATGDMRWATAFDTILPSLYASKGMEVVARVKFNDEFAPEGWDYDRYRKFNDGRPDVVFLTLKGKPHEYAPGSGKLVESYDEGVAAAKEAADPFMGRARFSLKPRQITPERLKRIKALQKQAEREGEETSVGNPKRKLASTGPRGRAFERAVMEERSRTFEPASLSEMAATAEARLGNDYEGVERSILAKWQDGAALEEWEQIAAARLTQNKVQAYLRSGSKQSLIDATQWGWLYRDVGTKSGRALASRRYTVDKDGINEIEDAIVEPSKYLREQMRKLQDKIDREVDEQELFSLRQRMNELMIEAADQSERALEALREKGLDPLTAANDGYADPFVKARAARIIAENKGGLGERAWDWALQWRYASMLSGVPTHMANIFGNSLHLLYEGPAKKVAEAAANAAVGNKGAASFGEVAAYMRAWLPGLARASRAWLQAVATDQPAFELELQSRGIDIGGRAASKLEVENARGGIPGTLGRVVRFPSLTMLTAQDEFFKSLASHTEATALAYRMAKGDQAKMLELLDDPNSGIWSQALDHARKVTFQDKPDTKEEPFASWAISTANSLRESVKLGPAKPLYLIFPFVQTPIRILQRGSAIPMHPVIMLAKAIRGEYGDQRELVRDTGTLALAAGIVMSVAELALRNREDDDELPLITGGRSKQFPEAEGQARTAPPYSVRIGGQWYTYGRMDPATLAVATTVDAANEWADAQARGEDETGMASAAFVRAVSSVLSGMEDRTYLRTFGDIMKALRSPEGSKAARMFKGTVVTPMIPAIVRRAATADEESLPTDGIRPHEGESAWPSMWRSVMGEGPTMPRRDVWGRPVEASGRSWLARFASPAPVVGDVDDIQPIDRYLLRYNDMVETGELATAKKWWPDIPSYTYTKPGEDQPSYMTDEQYDEYLRLSGEMALEAANRLASISEVPTEQRVEQIREAISKARSRARRRVLSMSGQ